MLTKVSKALLLLILLFAVTAVLCDAGDEFIMFDVRTSYNADYIKSVFSNVNVRHIFKVSSVDRYLVVVENDQSLTLSQLQVSYAPKVTQYPVGPLCDFLSDFGLTGCTAATAVDFEAENLLFLKFQFYLPSNMTTGEMATMLKTFGEDYKVTHKDIKSEVFYLVGRYPPRLYYFLNADLGHLADLVDRSVKIAGGPGNVLVNTQHLVEVK